jgi:hypothetical protein
MLKRFLVLIVLAVVLFVLANTIAHASPDGITTQPKGMHPETNSPVLSRFIEYQSISPLQ